MEKNKSAQRFRPITLLIVILWMGLSSLAFLVADFEMQRDMESRVREVNAQNLNQSLALAQILNRSVSQADMLLQFMAASIKENGTFDATHTRLLGDFLKPGIFNQIAVADSGGNLVYSAVPMKAAINISDREHFRAHIGDNSGKMYIASPRINQVAGAASIFLSRRLNGANGAFAGIVSVSLAPDYLLQATKQLQTGSSDSFVVLTTEGTFLARFPHTDSAQFATAVKTHPVLTKIRQGILSGAYESRGSADGVVRLGAFHKLSDYPVIVLAAVEKDASLGAVSKRGEDYRRWAGMIALLLGVLFWALWRQMRKNDQAEQSLRDANENLERNVVERTSEIVAANEKLIAQNQEISAWNQKFARMNEELEQRVNDRTAELKAAHDELSVRYAELAQSQEALRRSAEIQDVLREIAETAVLAGSLSEFYAKIHQSMIRVLPAQNLYISLVDEINGMIERPYCVDQENQVPVSRPIGKGLTEYFMRMGQAIHLTSELFNKLRDSGEVDLYFAPVFECMGAPLRDSRGKIFGVITLYLTEDMKSFEPEDSKVLSIVAAQVSLAMERKQAEETLIDSEARYRTVMAQSPEAVLLCDPDTGDIIETNSRFTERLGYSLQRDGKLNLFDMIVDEPKNIRFIMENLRNTGALNLQRRLFKHRNGSIVAVERSATMVTHRNRCFFVMTLRDVSEEVRREQEIQRDAQLAAKVQNALLSSPRASEYLEITTLFHPFGYVGGDLYFLDWRYEGSLLRGFLVDATGHGLGTALHTASLHVLLREVNELDLPLFDAMRWLNRRAGQYFDEGTFAGALGFEFDLQTRQLRWVCAGIPGIWVATQAQQGIVQCPGMCLGIMEDETFDTHSIQIETGDSFYFMTDGLSDLLERSADLPLDQYMQMVELLRALSESPDCRDDATAICCHVRSLPEPMVRREGWPRTLRFNGYGDYNRYKGEMGKILMEVTGLEHSIQEVAVNEALANAMECRDGVPRQYSAQIRFNKVGNRLIVRVKSSRIGFAGNAVLRRLRSHPEEMFEFVQDASMGRGIPIMLATSHKMTYNSEGTEVLLSWKICRG